MRRSGTNTEPSNWTYAVQLDKGTGDKPKQSTPQDRPLPFSPRLTRTPQIKRLGRFDLVTLDQYRELTTNVEDGSFTG